VKTRALPRAPRARQWRQLGRDPGTWIVSFFVAFAIAFVAWTQLHSGSDRTTDTIADLAFLPVNLAAGLLAWRVTRHRGIDAATRRAWMFIGAAYLSWWAGDCLWFWYEIIQRSQPSPSLADIGYLAFYPLLLAGLLSMPNGRRHRGDANTMLLDACTVLVGAGLIVWYLVVGPTVHGHPAGFATTALSLAYPAGDLVLIFGVAVVLLRNPNRATAGALRVLVAAIGLFVVADVTYAHQSIVETYRSGSLTDGFWMMAQVLLIVSAHWQWMAQRRADDEETAADDPVDPQFAIPRISRLPYLAIAAGYGLLLSVGVRQARYPLGDLLLGSVALTSLVVTRQVAALRENVALLKEMHSIAVTDSLTGLATRRSFVQQAEVRTRGADDSSVAVIMIDVDHFKVVNDTHGHGAGDVVLQEVARRCRAALRGGDILARYGGDEIVALLPGADTKLASVIAERLRRDVGDEPIDTELGPVHVSLSLGVAAAAHTKVDELLRRADVALYDAKEAGRDCARTFNLLPV